jgi:acyl phosphate:glycerol-3-phosphate acyltransferase
VIELVVKVLASYLLGSVMGGLVVGRLRGGVDIRTLGSGNAGGTNALRTQGTGFAFWVLVIDVAKGWLAAGFVAELAIPGVTAGPMELRSWLPATCGAAAILGHVYPAWHGFRGGKGVATLVGALAGVAPLLLLPVLLTWLLAAVLFGFVSLASMLAAASLPVFVLWFDAQPRGPLLAFGAFVAAIVLFTHRSNLARLRARSEPRAHRLWLLGLRR